MNQAEWMVETRQAWRQAHEKKQGKGHITKHCPWTWKQFRAFFRIQLEQGVNLNIHHLQTGEWPELLQACKRGMMLPHKAPF